MTAHVFCLVLGLGVAQEDPAAAAQRLVEQLGSEDIAAREEAVRGLKSLGEAARAALEKAASSTSADIAHRAKSLLRRLDIAKGLTSGFLKARSDAVDRLASEDANEWTRVLLESNQWTEEGLPRYPTLRRPDLEPLVAAAFSGAKSGEEIRDLCILCEDWRLRSAIPELVRLLKHSDVRVRERAALYLGEFECVEYEETLAALLKARGLDPGFGAAEGLVSMGARSRLPEIVRLGNQNLVVRSIGKLGGREHIDIVLAMLKRGFAANTAIEALGVLRASEHADQVAAYLKDAVAETRSLAAEALGRMGATEHADAVAELLADPDWNCGIRSVLATEALGQARHVPRLIPLMKDPRHPVRAYAIRAVKTLGGSDRIPELAGLLGDPDKETRVGAASALIELKSKAHVPTILKLIGDEQDGRKLYANYENLLIAGAGLFRLDLTAGDRRTLVEAYRRHGRSEVYWVRHSALIALLLAGELTADEQAALVTDVKEYRGVALGPRLATALAQVHEKKAWARLNVEIEAARSVETSDDFRSWLKQAGFTASWEGNLALSARLDKGRRLSPVRAVEMLTWEPRSLYPEGDSLLILRWDAALEKWAKRLGKN